MNSTPSKPASSIRLTALVPPPPTPTTRMTAGKLREGWNRRRSRDRASGGLPVEAEPSACEPPSADSSLAATRGRGASRSPPPRNRSASPLFFRLDFFFIYDLSGEGSIAVGGFARGSVAQDGGTLNRCFGELDRLAHYGVVNEIAKVTLEQLHRFAGVNRAAVVHGGQDTGDVDVGIQVLPHQFEGALQLSQT